MSGSMGAGWEETFQGMEQGGRRAGLVEVGLVESSVVDQILEPMC